MKVMTASRENPNDGLSYGAEVPHLVAMADLLRWAPADWDPLDWRIAFEKQLERRISSVLNESEPDACIEECLALLAEKTRRRFLSAPAVAAMLRRHVGDQFDGRLFARMLLAELGVAGHAVELPESLWTARGDRWLDLRAPERWAFSTVKLGDTGIALDVASSFPFPDDEFGIAETAPHNSVELEIAIRKVLAAIEALRDACPPALALVSSVVEVLALRRETANATAFYSSTFPGCPGLVRLTNTHLPETGTRLIVEALVHEAIHCILHIHEELEEPFVRKEEHSHAKITSPWTGAPIRLQSYIHACAVWYGIYWLWSAEGFAAGPSSGEVDFLKQRACRGFQYHPVSRGLAPFGHLLNDSIKVLLCKLEERMLQVS
jgi:hypothetical protein